MKKISNKQMKKVNGGATTKKSSNAIVEVKSSKNTKTGKVVTSTSSKAVNVLNLPKGQTTASIKKKDFRGYYDKNTKKK